MKSITLFFLSITILTACSNHKQEGVAVSDATLYSLSQNISSFTYFKNSHDTLTTAPESEHFNFVRVRFNPKATAALNSNASGLAQAVFPDESMIVKEVYGGKGGPLESIVIMYKLHNATNSGAGWVWCELSNDGSTRISSTLKGVSCIGCHSSGTNADLVRTFSLH